MEKKGVEETRDGARVAGVEAADGPAPDVASGREDARRGWLEAGAEDPAFFIKPADEG